MMVLIIFTLVSGVMLLSGIALMILSIRDNDIGNIITGLGCALLSIFFLALFLSLIL